MLGFYCCIHGNTLSGLGQQRANFDRRFHIGSTFMAQSTDTTLPQKQILVVDDEPLVAETIRFVLTSSGHKVEMAVDAEEALALFAADKFDLVITDLSLPTLDGFELASAIKERCATQPIILITAYADTLDTKRKDFSKVDFVLGKPFSLEDMRDTLAKAFALGEVRKKS
ncbi:MAG: putative Histidine kinase [Pedosphaera sp.]|nr:putative Histidine kinase [Pedosphaera sp.]